MEILITISLILGLSYLLLIAFFALGWQRLPSLPPHLPATPKTPISILIPFRNEVHNLPTLLQNLHQLQYPESLLQIVLVDDESTDTSAQLVNDYLQTHSLPWQLIRGKGGKKHSLALASSAIKHPWILALDADITFNPHLLQAYDHVLQGNSNLKMIAGPLCFSPSKSRWSGMMQLEFISLVVSGAGGISLRKPFMLNGANLLYSSEILKSENLRAEVTSGDDFFLMQSTQNQYGSKSITFLKDPRAIVSTSAPDSLAQWCQQHLRWTSKAKHYGQSFATVVALIVFLHNAALVGGLVLSLFYVNYFPFLIFGFLSKVLIDYILLSRSWAFFDQEKLKKYFLFLEILYPIYIVFVGTFGHFSKKNWKGRDL